MKVKALQNILYNGTVISEGETFDIDEVSAGIAKKYNRIEVLDGGAVETVDDGEIEAVEGLPPLKAKRK